MICVIREKVISFVLLLFTVTCSFTSSVKRRPVRKYYPVNRKLLYIRSKKRSVTSSKLLLGGVIALPSISLVVSTVLLCSSDEKVPAGLPENDVNVKSADEIKICTVDEQFIKSNFFLCGWKNNSCWNDVFIQFLMLPDIRCRKYGSAKINKTIEWINKQLSERYDGNFLNRKIYIPKEYRPISDGYENWLSDGKFHSVNNLFHGRFDGFNWMKLGLVGLLYRYCIRNYSPVCSDLNDAFDTLSKQQTYQNNYLVQFNNCSTLSNPNTPEPALKDVKRLFECHFGYFPTFTIVGNVNHYCSCVILYDVNSEVKFVLWLDGIAQGMQIISKQQILQKLSNLSNRSQILVIFSHDSIVKQYYTSC